MTLIELFNSIYPLSQTFWDELNALVTERSWPKKSMLLVEGDVCTEIHFIARGLARAFYYKDGEEVTAWFMKEGDVIISVESFFKQKRSLESIELLEDSIVVSLPYTVIQSLYARHLEFNIVGRVLTEHYYAMSEERLYALRMRTSKERYDLLLKNHPEIFQRVPLKYISSYLGMRPETLSRIRAKIT